MFDFNVPGPVIFKNNDADLEKLLIGTDKTNHPGGNCLNFKSSNQLQLQTMTLIWEIHSHFVDN